MNLQSLFQDFNPRQVDVVDLPQPFEWLLSSPPQWPTMVTDGGDDDEHLIVIVDLFLLVPANSLSIQVYWPLCVCSAWSWMDSSAHPGGWSFCHCSYGKELVRDRNSTIATCPPALTMSFVCLFVCHFSDTRRLCWINNLVPKSSLSTWTGFLQPLQGDVNITVTTPDTFNVWAAGLW